MRFCQINNGEREGAVDCPCLLQGCMERRLDLRVVLGDQKILYVDESPVLLDLTFLSWYLETLYIDVRPFFRET